MVTALRYLFIAVFDDSTQFVQNSEDISDDDPTKSCYYDLLQLCKSKNLTCFALISDNKCYSVDLVTGKFEIDEGIWVDFQPSSAPIPKGGKFELIYFRDHEATIGISSDGEVLEERDTHKYRFGWHYRLGDKVWTQTMVIE